MIAVLLLAMLPAGAQDGQPVRVAMLGSIGAAAAGPSSAAMAVVDGVDLTALQGQVARFEQRLNRELRQSFEHPFALLQDAKGIYLPHFGVAFHMEINLVPMRIISPFDPRPYTEQELAKAGEARKRRLKELKDGLTRMLLENAGDLSEVPSEQYVAVVVHLFRLPSEGAGGEPVQMVMETSRKALMDSRAAKSSAEEFAKQVTFLEF